MTINPYMATLRAKLACGIFLLASLTAGAQSAPSKCAPSPDFVPTVQANGAIISTRALGDALLHCAVTPDGYPVLMNAAGNYEFAKRNAEGNLVLSGVPAETGIAGAVKAGLVPNQFYGAEYAQKIYAQASIGAAKGPNAEGGHDDHIQTFPTKGKRKILAILIQYPDLKSKFSRNHFDSLFNADNYAGTGSFAQYYRDNSFGKLDLSVDVVGWYTAQNNYKYYGDDNGNGYPEAQELVREAVDAAASSVDYSKYDNDGDGKVDGIIIIHAGPGAEEGGKVEYAWSHRYSIFGAKYNNTYITDYMLNPETRFRGTTKADKSVGIGVYCHEFGHVLGLPDFYATNWKQGAKHAGTGDWNLMAGGSWLGSEAQPGSHDAFCKEWLGWLSPTVLKAEDIYSIPLPDTKNQVVYRINTTDNKQYYLLENYQLKGNNAKLNGHGLAIWRVNESILKAGPWSWNTINNDPDNLGLKLMEADGKDHLLKGTNRGDAGDLFPGSTNRRVINDESSPSMKLSSGANSGVALMGITEEDDSSITFEVGMHAYAEFSLADPSVCVGNAVTVVNNSFAADEYSWDFGDGFKSTAESPQHAYAEAGTYTISLTIKGGSITNEYSQEITVEQGPVAKIDFKVKGDTLVINNLSTGATRYWWFWGNGFVGYRKDTVVSFVYKSLGTYTLKLVVANADDCRDTLEQVVVIDGTNGIADFGAGSTSYIIAPNPAADGTALYASQAQASVLTLHLFDATGRQLSSRTGLNLTEGINRVELPELGGLNPGIYYFFAQTAQGQTRIPVMVR